MLGIFGDPFGDHLGERAALVALEMPFGGDDRGHEALELGLVGDQLGEQMAQVPFEQHAADVENDCARLAHRRRSHRTKQNRRRIAPAAVMKLDARNPARRRELSPGAP